MDTILEHCTGTMSIVDDVGVFGKDEAEHDANLHNLIKKVRRHGLVFNIDKCEIKRQSLKFFSLVFDAEGAHPDPKRIRDIEQMRSPVNSTELQEFLGIATYMSPSLPKLSQQTAPLRDLLKKDAEFEWTSSHDAVFEDTKALICRHVTLSYFRPEVESVVQGSTRGLGLYFCRMGRQSHSLPKHSAILSSDMRILSERCWLWYSAANVSTRISLANAFSSSPTRNRWK